MIQILLTCLIPLILRWRTHFWMFWVDALSPKAENGHNLHISKMAATDKSNIYNFSTIDDRNALSLSNTPNFGMEKSFLEALSGSIFHKVCLPKSFS